MTPYLYKTFIIRETIERGATPQWTAVGREVGEMLAAFGSEGWELVTSVTAQPAPRVVETRYVFKRPVAAPLKLATDFWRDETFDPDAAPEKVYPQEEPVKPTPTKTTKKGSK